MTKLIELLPDFPVADAGGFIRISGHRIGYHHVVALFNEGYSAESLWEEFPTLPLATIYKVAQCHEEVRRQESDKWSTLFNESVYP